LHNNSFSKNAQRYGFIAIFCIFAVHKMSEMKICCVIICWLVCFDLFAQKITADEYINIYKDLAITEMKRSGIPASIKLAQGMLESGNGNSRLAIVANNHFGIKCHGWEGEEIYHDDDKKNECFRRYKNAKDSWIDHTDFLTSRSRYAFLFEYESTDYKSWATGLRKAGYATDPNYSQLLITLIERHSLYQYDTGVQAAKIKPPQNANRRNTPARTTPTDDDFASFNIDKYPIRENNRTNYVNAREGDTYASLTKALDLMPWQLPKYNEIMTSNVLYEGQIIYLQPKRRKAEQGKETHTVRDGETMYDISQQYAIKLSRLYALNRMEEGTQPSNGNILNLRKKKKK